ncbi:uncharacterized protein SPPG_06291 [Spizellomyces punctatus DAOM BR117]|uniref:Protein transport protein sec16 n=1 Tax=Spizellomyces punctatus (strain DAOM BR117) TaxID=645134 RepID=A0A0L0HAN4_SPIPD|nr:uncharacterized protein SPPG_06291 [Spizellomyces punctatus DAOM BR117]KNC98610.1 hypothetical protein SPPG_06291 [Spizellomyces punctatus DAOM BR117]|eukprot:XP_016606650.1 hypothetical protein SPPG_06291 [Spizellomyces punctatus DAOM BR117]
MHRHQHQRGHPVSEGPIPFFGGAAAAGGANDLFSSTIPASSSATSVHPSTSFSARSSTQPTKPPVTIQPELAGDASSLFSGSAADAFGSGADPFQVTNSSVSVRKSSTHAPITASSTYIPPQARMSSAPKVETVNGSSFFDDFGLNSSEPVTSPGSSRSNKMLDAFDISLARKPKAATASESINSDQRLASSTQKTNSVKVQGTDLSKTIKPVVSSASTTWTQPPTSAPPTAVTNQMQSKHKAPSGPSISQPAAADAGYSGSDTSANQQNGTDFSQYSWTDPNTGLQYDFSGQLNAVPSAQSSTPVHSIDTWVATPASTVKYQEPKIAHPAPAHPGHTQPSTIVSTSSVDSTDSASVQGKPLLNEKNHLAARHEDSCQSFKDQVSVETPAIIPSVTENAEGAFMETPAFFSAKMLNPFAQEDEASMMTMVEDVLVSTGRISQSATIFTPGTGSEPVTSSENIESKNIYAPTTIEQASPSHHADFEDVDTNARKYGLFDYSASSMGNPPKGQDAGKPDVGLDDLDDLVLGANGGNEACVGQTSIIPTSTTSLCDSTFPIPSPAGNDLPGVSTDASHPSVLGYYSEDPAVAAQTPLASASDSFYVSSGAHRDSMDLLSDVSTFAQGFGSETPGPTQASHVYGVSGISSHEEGRLQEGYHGNYSAFGTDIPDPTQASHTYGASGTSSHEEGSLQGGYHGNYNAFGTDIPGPTQASQPYGVSGTSSHEEGSLQGVYHGNYSAFGTDIPDPTQASHTYGVSGTSSHEEGSLQGVYHGNYSDFGTDIPDPTQASHTYGVSGTSSHEEGSLQEGYYGNYSAFGSTRVMEPNDLPAYGHYMEGQNGTSQANGDLSMKPSQSTQSLNSAQIMSPDFDQRSNVSVNSSVSNRLEYIACPKCSKRNDTESNFCSKCGTSIAGLASFSSNPPRDPGVFRQYGGHEAPFRTTTPGVPVRTTTPGVESVGDIGRPPSVPPSLSAVTSTTTGTNIYRSSAPRRTKTPMYGQTGLSGYASAYPGTDSHGRASPVPHQYPNAQGSTYGVKLPSEPQAPEFQDPLGRHRGHCVAVFGSGGKLFITGPKRQNRYITDSQGRPSMMEKSYPGPMCVIPVHKVVDNAWIQEILKVPGPLVGSKIKHKKKDVLKFAEDMIKAAETDRDRAATDLQAKLRDGMGASVDEDKALDELEDGVALVKLIKMLVDNDGTLLSAPAAKIDSITQQIREVLAVPTLFEGSVMDRIQAALVQGDREGACNLAVGANLWPHALVVATNISKETYCDVIMQFARSEFTAGGLSTNEGRTGGAVEHVDRPGLRVLFALFGGMGPTAITPSLQYLSKWGEILCLILSNRTPNDLSAVAMLGDRLHSYGKKNAAQCCYLLASLPNTVGGIDSPQARVVLLGADHRTYPGTFFRSLDALQKTEIFEFSQSLWNNLGVANSLPHLQAFKIWYASLLADLGLNEQAAKYCESVEHVVKTYARGSPYFHRTFGEVLGLLSGRLAAAQSGNVTSEKEGSSWLSKLSSIGARGLDRFMNNALGEADTATSVAAAATPLSSAGHVGRTTPGPLSAPLYGSASPMTLPVDPRPSSTPVISAEPGEAGYSQLAGAGYAAVDQGAMSVATVPMFYHQPYSATNNYDGATAVTSQEAANGTEPVSVTQNGYGYATGYGHDTNDWQGHGDQALAWQGQGQESYGYQQYGYNDQSYAGEPHQQAYADIAHNAPQQTGSDQTLAGQHDGKPLNEAGEADQSLQQQYDQQGYYQPEYAPQHYDQSQTGYAQYSYGEQNAQGGIQGEYSQLPENSAQFGYPSYEQGFGTDELAVSDQKESSSTQQTQPVQWNSYYGGSYAEPQQVTQQAQAAVPESQSQPAPAGVIEEEDPLGLGNSAVRRDKEKASTQTTATEPTSTEQPAEQSKSESEAAKSDASKSRGLFSAFGSLFSGRRRGSDDAQTKEGSGPKKANLGEKNAFYYDEKKKKWVNKNADAKEEQSTELPPPPMAKSMSAPVSRLGTPGLPPASGAPVNADVSRPPSAPGSAQPSPAPSPALDNPAFGAALAGKRSGAGRRGARNRYVDVFNPDGNKSGTSSPAPAMNFIPTATFGTSSNAEPKILKPASPAPMGHSSYANFHDGSSGPQHENTNHPVNAGLGTSSTSQTSLKAPEPPIGHRQPTPQGMNPRYAYGSGYISPNLSENRYGAFSPVYGEGGSRRGSETDRKLPMSPKASHGGGAAPPDI